jgi:hypothetical protein
MAAVPPRGWKAEVAPLCIVDPDHVRSGEESVALRERVDRLRSLLPGHDAQATAARSDDGLVSD